MVLSFGCFSISRILRISSCFFSISTSSSSLFFPSSSPSSYPATIPLPSKPLITALFWSCTALFLSSAFLRSAVALSFPSRTPLRKSSLSFSASTRLASRSRALACD